MCTAKEPRTTCRDNRHAVTSAEYPKFRKNSPNSAPKNKRSDEKMGKLPEQRLLQETQERTLGARARAVALTELRALLRGPVPGQAAARPGAHGGGGAPVGPRPGSSPSSRPAASSRPSHGGPREAEAGGEALRVPGQDGPPAPPKRFRRHQRAPPTWTGRGLLPAPPAAAEGSVLRRVNSVSMTT